MIRKIVILFLFSFLFVCSYSQVIWQPRSSPAVVAVDSRVKGALTMYMPVASDTTLNGGPDSTGAYMFRWADTAVYLRVPKTGVPGNKWVLWFKLNSSPQTSGVASFNGRTGTVTLVSSDVTNALGFNPVTSARTLTINGVTQDLSTNRSWTVGDVRTDGSYSNPSWISSLDWSKITGTPSFSGITSLNGQTNSSQTFGTPGTSGNAPNWVSSGGIHTLNIPMASTSGVNAGLIPYSFYNQIVTLTGSQTLTNKTLTSPFINFGGDANGDVLVRIGGVYTRLGVGSNGQIFTVNSGLPSWQNPVIGAGTVTDFSANDIPSLFTTNVFNSTTTPALSFSLTNVPQYSVWGRSNSGTGAPSYQILNSNFISNFTSAARGVISVTNTGSSGGATYNSSTGVLNIPIYASAPSGTVTTLSVGNLSPIFTSNVTNPTTTPAVAYTLSNINQYQVLGRSASGSGVPSYLTLSSAFISDFNTAVRNAISITTSGTSGASTYNSGTGVINIPNYTTGGGGGGGSAKEPVLNF